MLRPVLAAALLLAWACAPAPPRKDAPPRAGRAHTRRMSRFKAAVRVAPVQIRSDLSLAELARLPGAAGSGLKTQGITLVKRSLAVRTRFSTAVDRSAVTAWFDSVLVELAIDSITIHVPKEYPPGTCEHDAVLSHEREHARVAAEYAAAGRRDLESALLYADDLPTREYPYAAADAESAAAALKKKLDAVVDPVYAEFERALTQAQDALDRPDPYDAVYKRCEGWR